MNQDFKDLLPAFESCGVDYLIVGGYAVMEYTEPRYTKDLDVWIWSTRDNAEKVFRALLAFGAPLQDVKPEDFATAGMVFQMGVAPIRIDILMSIDGVEFSSAWERRSSMKINGTNAWLISKSDLIANKRASGRPQDLIDVANLEEA